MEGKEDKLFELIQTLTSQEKKYLTSFVPKTNDKKPMYFELYRWIDKFEEPNDLYLKKKLKKVNQEKQLPFLKNYLYNFILDKLFLLESENEYQAQINKLLIKANVLIEKHLLSQAKMHLDKAFKIAHEFEDFTYLLLIKNSQLNIHRKTLLGSDLLEKGTELFDSAIGDIDKIKNEWDYASVNFQFVNRFIYINRARNEEVEKEYQNLLTHPLLQDESKALTARSARTFHNVHSVQNLYQHNTDKYYEHSKAMVDSYHENEKRIEKDVHSYIGSLYTLSKSLIRRKQFKEVDKILEQIEALPKKYVKQCAKPRMQSHVYEMTVMILVNYYLHLNDIPKLHEKMLPFIDKFQNFKPQIRVITQLYMIRTFSFAHFCISSFEKALEWDVFFLNEYSEHSKSRMYLITKLSHLILHFELKNFDYLPYEIRSTYRFLKKRNSALKFENRIIALLRTVMGKVEKQDIKALFSQLRDDLIDIAKDPKENAIHDFIYIQWLEHKITGKSLEQCIKEDGLT